MQGSNDIKLYCLKNYQSTFLSLTNYQQVYLEKYKFKTLNKLDITPTPTGESLGLVEKGLLVVTECQSGKRRG